MELFQASHQWSERPDDQRFWTIQELAAATRAHADSSRTISYPFKALSLRQAGKDGADLELVGPKGVPAKLTHWCFSRLASYAKAPAEYVRGLPAALASQNINYGLSRLDNTAELLFHLNGELVTRTITTDKYSRIWNCDVADRLVEFGQYGWRTPPARPNYNGDPRARRATEQDVLSNRDGGGGLSVNVGDMIAPAGLYASDHDLFVFMVNENRRIMDGTEGGLSRGFFVRNSEVGDGALKATTFLYRHVCGNHIVWGAQGVKEFKIVHRGNADVRFDRGFMAELRTYADDAASDDESAISEARKFKLGGTKDEVLNALFKALRGDLSQKTITASYDQGVLEAETDTTLDPNTAWGFTQGLTSHSQTIPYADERSKMDRAAGKVMDLVF